MILLIKQIIILIFPEKSFSRKIMEGVVLILLVAGVTGCDGQAGEPPSLKHYRFSQSREASQTGVLNALNQAFPIGTELSRVTDWVESEGGTCGYYEKYPNRYYCRYKQWYMFIPIIWQEWIITVFVEDGTSSVSRFEVKVGLTGP